MDRQTFKRVKVISKNVREWAEIKAKELGHYNDLCGTCAVASAELHRRLKKAGIDSKIGLSFFSAIGSHCFVVSNGHIVDVTATQFGLNKIEIRKMNSNLIRTHRYWKHYQLFESVAGLKKQQGVEAWSSDQIPVED